MVCGGISCDGESKRKAIMQVVQGMKKIDLPIEQIVNVTKLPLEGVKKL